MNNVNINTVSNTEQFVGSYVVWQISNMRCKELGQDHDGYGIVIKSGTDNKLVTFSGFSQNTDYVLSQSFLDQASLKLKKTQIWQIKLIHQKIMENEYVYPLSEVLKIKNLSNNLFLLGWSDKNSLISVLPKELINIIINLDDPVILRAKKLICKGKQSD